MEGVQGPVIGEMFSQLYVWPRMSDTTSRQEEGEVSLLWFHLAHWQPPAAASSLDSALLSTDGLA